MKTSHTTKLGALALGFLLLTAFMADKLYTLKFTEETLNNHFNKLRAIKGFVEKSNLPPQEVLCGEQHRQPSKGNI